MRPRRRGLGVGLWGAARGARTPARESDHDAESAPEAVLVRLAEEEAAFVRGLSDAPAVPTYQATLRVDGGPPPPDLMRRLAARGLPVLRFVPAGGAEADYDLTTAAGGGDGAFTVRVRDRNPRHRSGGADPPDQVLAVTRLAPGRWRVSESR